MKVVVLAGGRSSEHDVSLSSAAAICTGLAELGHEVETVLLEREGRWRINETYLDVTPGGGLLDADVVFPALHGPFGEDGTVQGLLELLDVPYVGADTLASALSMNKALFKDILGAAGFPQVEYQALTYREFSASGTQSLSAIKKLGFPVFVKPARLGSSVGISKASSEIELEECLQNAFRHDSLALVERASTGMEVECSVMGLRTPVTSLPGEITLMNSSWYDYEAKYTPGAMELIVPARLSNELIERVRFLAAETFTRVRCSGLARVDFFVEGDNVLINELNTMPGFTPTSGFPKMFAASGIAFTEVCQQLIDYAIERYESERTSHVF